MTITTPIEIDLLTFFKTSKFDYLKLGQTKEWIIKNFPDPNEVYANSYESPIWFYGDIELHFNNSNELFLIFSDHINTLQRGNRLRLKKWILNEPEKLTLENVIDCLNQERISYKVANNFGFIGILASKTFTMIETLTYSIIQVSHRWGYPWILILMVVVTVIINLSLRKKGKQIYL